MGNVNCKSVAENVVGIANCIGSKINVALDFVSYNVCPAKPSTRFATDNLKIPADDYGFIQKIFVIVSELLGVISHSVYND